jgi:hypothetical protein
MQQAIYNKNFWQTIDRNPTIYFMKREGTGAK